jgi:hypothetical protein
MADVKTMVCVPCALALPCCLCVPSHATPPSPFHAPRVQTLAEGWKIIESVILKLFESLNTKGPDIFALGTALDTQAYSEC